MDRPGFGEYRKHVDAIVRAVLEAVEPGACVGRHWPGSLRTSSGPCVVIAVGKASVGMAREAVAWLGDRIDSGVVTAPPELLESAGSIHSHLVGVACDHPMPTRRNVEGASAIERCILEAPSDATIVVCISGGGSAHLTAPIEEVTLEELVAMTEAMLRAGAPIDELNCVRKHVERLKGGGLARLAHPRRVVSLIMSDVVGDRLDVIASGPTSPDPTTFGEALGVLSRRGVAIPAGVRVVLESGATGCRAETPKPGDPVFERCEHHIVGSNQRAVEAASQAAESLGFTIAALEHDVTGEAGDVGRALAARPLAPLACVVIGGETTVTVGGARGVGGRNQELALAAAIELQGRPKTALLAIATDGVDGVSQNAGAVVTSETVLALIESGIDPHCALANHDSTTALDSIGATIRTGPTGTNVNDVAVLLAYVGSV